MGILKNNNRAACIRLAVKCLKSAKIHTFFLGASVFLTALLYTVSFCMTDGIRAAYLLDDQVEYGSASHIIFSGLSEDQADRISVHESVEESARMDSLGTLSDAVLEYRQIYLAKADADYAQTQSAVPTEGRMPRAEGEIALDTLTLDSLGLPHRTGETVYLTWTPFSGGESVRSAFTLCGFWETESAHTESCAWISEDAFSNLKEIYGGSEKITLGVKLYQPGDLEDQAEKILSDLGIEGISWSTNLAWNPARIAAAEQETYEYLVAVVFVILCGFLLIYNLLLIALRERLSLLASVKSLGMTPAQTGVFSSALVLIPAVIVVPFGILAGFLIFILNGPDFLEAMTGVRISVRTLSVLPLMLAALFSLLTAWAAGRAALGRLRGKSPAQIRQILERKTASSGRAGNRGKVTVFRLALRSLRVRRGSLFAAALSLLLSSLLLGAMYIRYISYDGDYYAAESFLSDYSLIDSSCASDYQRYNEQAGNIPSALGEEIRALNCVEEYGEFLTHEVDLQADDSLRNLVEDFYDAPFDGAGGMTRKESMEGDPEWIQGLEKLEETGTYRSVLIGADGLALDCALYYELLSGSFDAEKFASGDYVLAVGASSAEGVSAAPAGSTVVIGGKTFTVMATVQEWGIIPSGRNSRESAFCLNYVMPPAALKELYPETNIRQIMVNTVPGGEEEFESFLSENSADGITVSRRSETMDNFWREVRAVVAVGTLTGILLLAAGILNFLNVTVSRVFARYREFALYQSLGMQKNQLRRLVLYEGLIYAGVCILGILPLAAVGLKYGMNAFYNSDLAYLSNNDWAVTYRYSAAPLWIIAGIILLIGAFMPQICLSVTERQSVVDRIRYKE